MKNHYSNYYKLYEVSKRRQQLCKKKKKNNKKKRPRRCVGECARLDRRVFQSISIIQWVLLDGSQPGKWRIMRNLVDNGRPFREQHFHINPRPQPATSSLLSVRESLEETSTTGTTAALSKRTHSFILNIDWLARARYLRKSYKSVNYVYTQLHG